MIAAFCPGHITCFFHPVRSYDLLSAGSRGVGIKLSKGSSVTLEERRDDRIEVSMDGGPAECGITVSAIRSVDPDRGYDVTIENDLPVGQGFGMSAAGSIAAALCACEFAGKNQMEAFRVAHTAEITGGGGYGDVSGIMGRSHVPIRSVAGLPPFGKVVNSGLKLNLSVAVLGGPLNTGHVLSDENVSRKIQHIGSRAVTEFMESPSLDSLFSLSNRFSSSIGLETPGISSALSRLREKGRAGMCMLGRSIFTDLSPADTRGLLGDSIEIIGCQSTDRMPGIIRKV